jgi:hypothetical protein
MSQKIYWITPAGSLGIISEEDYFQYQLSASQSQNNLVGSELSFRIIAGQLGEGLQLDKFGMIQGVPVIDIASTTEASFTQTFTVRATAADGAIADRTFSITINANAVPEIIPPSSNLGSYFNGTWVNIQLDVVEPNPIATLSWSVISGSLPLGLSLLPQTGVLVGHIMPFYPLNSTSILDWDKTGWDMVSWDLETPKAQNHTYEFEIQVFDGTSYTSARYTIEVISKDIYSIDNTYITVDSNLISIDTDNYHIPFITTLAQSLPTQRQLSNLAFKFDGIDLDGDDILFGLVTTNAVGFDQGPTPESPSLSYVGFDSSAFDESDISVPEGLTLDPVTGWLTGNIGSQAESSLTYTFKIYCYKKEKPTYKSDSVTFTLTVLGDINNTVTWLTPSNLGEIDNGAISELSILATAANGKTLNYRLKPGTEVPNFADPTQQVVQYYTAARSKLPQGLTLQTDGLIVGRTTFEYFKMDGETTTFDKNSTTFDSTYQFTVTASDGSLTGVTPYVAPTISADQTFTVRISNFNKTPYQNLYLRALTTQDQRASIISILNNTSIFPDNYIYRLSDPWFGKATEIKFLFAAGLDSSTVQSYLTYMAQNHYNKRVYLGEIKTAVAVDENFNPKYEVIYIDILDADTNNGKSVSFSIDRTKEVKPPYNVMPFTYVYPNSFDNMLTSISNLGYANRGALPGWMLSPQDNGQVLGFTRGIVLAYTVPGASKKIAFRLSQQNITFNNLDFIADRYQLDRYLDNNFDITTQSFTKNDETTFDRLTTMSSFYKYVGTGVAVDAAIAAATANGSSSAEIATIIQNVESSITPVAVDYAVTVPFDQIDSHSLDYIAARGGLDGSMNFQTGTRIIFAKQENYPRPTNPTSDTLDYFDTNTFDKLPFAAEVVAPETIQDDDGWIQQDGLYGALPYGQDGSAFAFSTEVNGYIAWSASMIIDQSTGLTSYGVPNQRAGIWEILIDASNMVTLQFVTEARLNEYVIVKNGISYRNTKLFYDPSAQYLPGNTVPAYSVLTDKLASESTATSFDQGATRFFERSRDPYTAPNINDIFIKFPKDNIYQ